MLPRPRPLLLLLPPPRLPPLVSSRHWPELVALASLSESLPLPLSRERRRLPDLPDDPPPRRGAGLGLRRRLLVRPRLATGLGLRRRPRGLVLGLRVVRPRRVGRPPSSDDDVM